MVIYYGDYYFFDATNSLTQKCFLCGKEHVRTYGDQTYMIKFECKECDVEWTWINDRYDPTANMPP